MESAIFIPYQCFSVKSLKLFIIVVETKSFKLWLGLQEWRRSAPSQMVRQAGKNKQKKKPQNVLNKTKSCCSRVHKSMANTDRAEEKQNQKQN